ncbi:outer membrane beta-barrel protein [Hymenobacter caeli]|uniref:Outer membrane protein beta-barrel domain-containing protein n=1 Tax=Hymenobacter caeli TaxID=2735894 RepID=A0ABX2FQL2_9BACT|nr:outer membrane beta-barrel protein [Hymenobacter caeli]NRT19456.1 hypothetical protein [Hymenobacter caeli]
MKRITTSLLAVALLAGATAASAQTTFRLGLRGGANRALTTVDGASNFINGINLFYSADKLPVYAWQAGAVLEMSFGKLALQPALVFSQKGEKLHTYYSSGDYALYYTETTSTNRYNWLELPLNVVYTLHGDHGLQAFAGPYVALAVGGNQQGTVYRTISVRTAPQDFDTQVSYGPNTNNRRLDAGVNFGVGYRQGPLQVQLGYALGLRNLHQDGGTFYYDYGHNFNADAAYNRVAQLTGTYFFSL